MEACKRSTQKQKQRVEEQQLELTVVLPLLIFSSRRSILFPRGNRRGSSSECLRKMLKRRKDLPHRRMPVIIFIIPLPSAEMSSFKYALRSKYIVYDVFLCQDTVFGRKYAFYLITPNFSIDLTLQKHKKGTIARAL